LFGDDVDSIRIIDPETQLSERRLLHVSIIPNVETQFGDEDKVSLLDFLPENTVVWIQDEELTKEKLLTAEEDLEIFLRLRDELNVSEKDEDNLEKKEVTEDDFINGSDFFDQLKNRHQVHFGFQTARLCTF
jgi:transcription-repair coupling factor (superfamily II helicase)